MSTTITTADDDLFGFPYNLNDYDRVSNVLLFKVK